MKKASIFLMVALSTAIFSCKKMEQATPAAPTNPAVNAKLPEFNEKNSTAVTWDQLPENLRTAQVISVKNTAPTVDATYKYYIGPWGGGGGGAYYIYPTGSYDRIYAVAMRAGAYVDALIIWYVRPDGTLYSYYKGGSGGSYYIQYLSSSEYISAIGGRSGSYIDRLTIYTNYKSFSYGGNGGSPFYAGVAYGDQILGFFGGSGAYVDRLGGYVYSK
jgi:hypothetical protein